MPQNFQGQGECQAKTQTKKNHCQRWSATGLKAPKKKRNIAAYHQYKVLDKPRLMFLEETIKNLETKKKKSVLLQNGRCQSPCLGGLIQRYLDTTLSPLHTYSSTILVLRDIPLLQSCVFLEKAEEKAWFVLIIEEGQRCLESMKTDLNQPSKPKCIWTQTSSRS